MSDETTTPEEPIVEAPPEPEPPAPDSLEFTEIEGEFELRNLSQREIDLRIVPWNTAIYHQQGLEAFERGAFRDVSPSKVLLKGPDSWGKHTGPVVGKGVSLEERSDAAYMTFKVSKTTAGDDLLALMDDKTITGASIAFKDKPDGFSFRHQDGRRLRVHQWVELDHVVATWRPAYEQAGVIAMRSKEDEVSPVADSQAPVAPDESEAVAAVQSAMGSLGDKIQGFTDGIADRIDKLEERSRSQFTVPASEPEKVQATRGEWMEGVLKILSGDRLPDLQMRALADVITADNAGIVPDNFSSELIGIIDARRPFMDSTRRLATPSSGMRLTVPVITQRPTVALQSEEKAELSSTTTKIDTVDFDVVTKGGAGDLSLQILKRADRSFLDLYLQLLAEAYAIEAETEAVESLLGADVDDGNTLDPENLLLGSAFTTAFDVIRRPPDTMWVSSEAIAAFIDAKSNTSNSPLYPGLVASATAGGGISGTISGLRVVHVPVLNGAGADVIVGPSTGFAWAEDGTYTLQVDVPARAGRDVALVGMLWFAPWYPTAFTVYNLTS